MAKRVFIIHGWGDDLNGGWIPWVKPKLEERGYEVITPLMPDTDNPRMDAWVGKLKDLVGKPQGEDVLIGHSVGCQTIWRFLEQVAEGEKVDKVIMVAPWFKLTNLEEEDWPIANPWIKTPIDFDKAKSRASSFVALFSDNDPFVPLEENRKIIEKELNPKIIVLSNRQHFNVGDGINDLPEILDLL